MYPLWPLFDKKWERHHWPSVHDQRIVEMDRRVKAAGGELEGPIRVSLSFSGLHDIDLHVVYEGFEGRPRRQSARRSRQRSNSRSASFFQQLGSGNNGRIRHHVFYGLARTNHCVLDVDANASSVHPEPCENIVFHKVPRQATYTVYLDHYRTRGFRMPTPYVVVVRNGKSTTHSF